MCGHGRGHHGECECHGSRHGEHHGDCDCESEGAGGCECGGHEGHGECECGCHEGEGGEMHFERHFVTRAERIAELEAYLQDLKNEAQGVEERIAEIKAAGA